MSEDYARYTKLAPLVRVLAGVEFAQADRKNTAETHLIILATVLRVLYKPIGGRTQEIT